MSLRHHRIVIYVLAWSLTGLLGAGGVNATWRHNHPGASARDCLMTRNQMLAIGLMIGPLAMVIDLTEVGFVDGATLDASPTPPATENPHA